MAKLAVMMGGTTQASTGFHVSPGHKKLGLPIWQIQIDNTQLNMNYF